MAADGSYVAAMPTLEEQRQTFQSAAQGAVTLHLAFIGIANGLLEVLGGTAGLTPEALAGKAKVDAGYVQRWCEAAYAAGILDVAKGAYTLTSLGDNFRPSVPGTLMPLAVQAVLAGHMSERAAGLMSTGERPGESVLAERKTILPWFGPMLDKTHAVMFEREILPSLAVYRALDERAGVAMDLGCGNGWYLRKLAKRFPHLRGIGMDGFAENVDQATEAAKVDGLSERLVFTVGDILDTVLDTRVDLVAMNRALHHVWDRREKLFAIVREVLVPGGSMVVWEPRWPDDITALRDPKRRMMAFQNLSEHIQGNHFLRPSEIEAAMAAVGLIPETRLFADGNEAVVIGRKP